MLDLVGEVLESTERDAFFRRINDISVADGLMRNDDLRVAFGSQGSGFEERFLEPDALAVDVLSCLDVVDCVHHEVQVVPEIIVENMFIFRADSSFEGVELDITIHLMTNFACSLALIGTDVLSSEQKLSVQVTDLDIVVVSNG